MLHTVKAFRITWTNKMGEHSFYEFTQRSAQNAMDRMSSFNPRMEETIAQVYLTPAIKREFQKLVKTIRESDFNTSAGCEYPKAIMTEAMMDRGEATIIFTWQGTFYNETTKAYTKARAEKFMEEESFKAFLNREQATAQVELKENNNYHIRIHF